MLVGDIMEKLDIYKGLKCCADFLCNECPYRILKDEYGIVCTRTLITHLNSLLNGGK